MPADGRRELVELLAAAERPYLLAGRGAWIAGAGAALGELADADRRDHRHDRARARHLPARRVRPRRDGRVRRRGRDGARCARPTSSSPSGRPSTSSRRGSASCSAPTRRGQVDVADAATNPQVSRFIRGDAARRGRVPRRELRIRGAASSGWRDSIALAPLRHYEPGDGLAPDGRLDPRSVAARIAELLPADRVVVSDGGHLSAGSTCTGRSPRPTA